MFKNGSLYIFIVFIINNVNVGCKAEKKYENYNVMKLLPRSEDQLQVLRSFNPDGVEILKRTFGVNDSLDVLVPPNRRQFVKSFADSYHFDLNLSTNNFLENIKDEYISYRRNARTDYFDLFKYHSYAEISDRMDKLLEIYGDRLQVLKAGESYEGRPLKVAFISTDFSQKKPAIFVDAGIHAREWVAPAMAMYLLERLLENNPSVGSFNMIDRVDWIILPLVNPDGYEFSRIKPQNRLWRKTRSKSPSGCIGVDGNRNYGYRWGVSGTSRNPCDEQLFQGIHPFSESETRAVRDIMKSNTNIKLYVSLHAYGQYLVYPWGYTNNTLPPSWRQLNEMAKKVSRSVVKAGGKPFKVLSAGQWYPAAGGSDDYAFGACNIPYSYTMELTEGHEFIFPQPKLRTTLPQFFEGFRTFAHEVGSLFRHYKDV